MALWVDKYRPRSFSELSYHQEINERLEQIAADDAFPHLLIYGPSGAGKNTRLGCILRKIYGEGAALTKLETTTFTTPSNSKIELSTISSSFHIELNPSDAGFHDRVVVQQLIKTTAQTFQVADNQSHKTFKVVVISEANRLSREAQHALRRTMEKYAASCRLILIAESTSGLIDPILSRCLLIPITAPTNEEIVECLEHVAKLEKTILPPEFARKIAEKSERNMRRALLMFEACKVQQYPFSINQTIEVPQFEKYIQNTAQMILEKQTPERLMEIRERLFQLQIRCIPTHIVLIHLLDGLLPYCDTSFSDSVIQAAAKCDVNISKGTKPIFHLEAFVAKFMFLYKEYLDKQCSFL